MVEVGVAGRTPGAENGALGFADVVDASGNRPGKPVMMCGS